MAIRVKARSGESVEQMMRRFKKLCEKEGLNRDIKRTSLGATPARGSDEPQPPSHGERAIRINQA